jgi:multidrug transporter EmrE-like cation transporter
MVTSDLAILFEVTGTAMMKLSEGFSKQFFSMAILVCYLVSYRCLHIAKIFSGKDSVILNRQTNN